MKIKTASSVTQPASLQVESIIFDVCSHVFLDIDISERHTFAT